MHLSTVFAYALVTYVAVELGLLVAAVVTIRNPELHSRFKELMLYWPYVLVAAPIAYKVNALPRSFLPDNRYDPAPSSDVTRETYKIALKVVFRHLDWLTTDRDLQELLLNEYMAKFQATEMPSVTPSGQSGESPKVRGPRPASEWPDAPRSAPGRGQRWPTRLGPTLSCSASRTM